MGVGAEPGPLQGQLLNHVFGPRIFNFCVAILLITLSSGDFNGCFMEKDYCALFYEKGRTSPMRWGGGAQLGKC